MASGRLLVPMINRHQRKASSRFRESRRVGSGLRRCHDQDQLFRGAGLPRHSEATAGGIGGLLARSDHSTFNVQPSFYHADGNGNVTCLVDEQNTVVARYIYDPYGNITSSQGSLAEANLYRFSSKEFHPQSELVYYLYKYYEPNLQRWVNRDPIEEDGGVNLHGFVENSPLVYYDVNGHKALPPAVLIPLAVVAVGGVAAVICYCTTLNHNPPTPPKGYHLEKATFSGFGVNFPCGYNVTQDSKK